MKIRIGKEIHISWSILTQGENKPLEGRDLRLYLQDPNRRRRTLEFTTDDNTILVVIPANTLTRIGKYALILTENEGQEGQTAVDANPAFTLVETTREEDTNTTEAPNLEVATINLTTGNLTLRMVLQELFDGKDGGDMKTGDILAVLRDGELHRVSAKIGAGPGADYSAEIEALTAKVEENAANIAGAAASASEALTAAQTAQDAATTASENAAQAQELANEAKTTAEQIQGTADSALSEATAARSDAANAATDASNALSAANAAQEVNSSQNVRMDSIEGRVSNNQERISAVENKNTEQDTRLNNIESRLDTDIAGAISDASEALTAAQNAQTAASSASQNAGQAIGIANEAKEIAEGIARNADDALKKATEATGKADAAQKAAENEATARTEADTELQSQINGKQDNIDSLSKDEKDAFMISLGLGKIGVVSQKQNWNDVGVEPAYVMSEKVEGFISKDNIDSLISYGFAFNEGTGYFELNGLTDISLQEALNIVAAGKPNFSLCEFHYAGKKNVRTNLPIIDKDAYNSRYFGSIASIGIRMSSMANKSDIEVFVYSYKIDNVINTNLKYSSVSRSELLFSGCLKLEKIYNIPGTTKSFWGSFGSCVRLKELELVYLMCDVNLSESAYLSAKSTHIMIANANNNNAITITLHSDAKARWEASEYYEEDSQTIISKNITIA